MSKLGFSLAAAACVMTCTAWAANDPFVGGWKLNPSKSKLTDQMKVESVAQISQAMVEPPWRSPSRVQTPGKWFAKRTAMFSSRRTGSFPRTVVRSVTTSRVLRPMGLPPT